MDELHRLLINSLVGVIRVEIYSLSFYGGRQKDPTIVQYQQEIYERCRKGCDQDKEEYFIPAVVNEAELEDILRTNNLTREILQRTIYVKNNRNRPKIILPNFKLRCMHGKHRIEAAKRFLKPPETWWTIKLYCLDTRSK
jgi:hypothetical protein